MRTQWNRATSLTIACAALLLVTSCTRTEVGAPQAAKASQGAASMTTPKGVEAQPASVESELEQPASVEELRLPEAEQPIGLKPKVRGIDELDMGFEMGDIKVDLGGAGTPANGIPLGTPGLVKASIPSTRGGMRLARGESAEHSFGDVREGESYSKNFDFVSDGESPLVVKTIKPSCGCTRSEIELMNEDGSSSPYELGKEMPIGQKFQLLTEISTDGKHGHTEVTVMMSSNDPKGQTGIKLTADVEKVLELDPPNQMVLIDEMTVLEQKQHKLQIRATRGEHFMLSVGPEVQLPESIKLDFAPVEPDENGKAALWDVTVSLGPGLDEGRRNYPLYLASDIEIPSPKYPNADGTPKYFTSILSTQVNVIGLVSASPSFLGFGIVKPGQEIVRTVDIRCADTTLLNQNPPVRILGLYDDMPQYADAYEVSFLPLEGENGLRMSVHLKGMPEDVKGSFGGRIELNIGHPAKETLTVKFSGICRAALPGQ